VLTVLSALARAHTPPDPPEQTMAPMSPQAMKEMMQMDDTRAFGTVMIDQLEWRSTEARRGAWDMQAWYGGDSDKVWLKSEGVGGEQTSASAELLWDRTVSEWWSLQVGARNDFGAGPSRTWMAVGLQGIAPYSFDTEATFYVAEEGRTAARVKMEYDAYFTQRLVLQPKVEINAYGKSDPERGIGSGVSDLEVGARVRYEFRRELAPYVGINWSRLFGSTADLAHARGGVSQDWAIVVGVRFWF
jgi:copper resistance protein B